MSQIPFKWFDIVQFANKFDSRIFDFVVLYAVELNRISSARRRLNPYNKGARQKLVQGNQNIYSGDHFNDNLARDREPFFGMGAKISA